MNHFDKISNKIFNIKEQLTSNDYKYILEELGKLRPQLNSRPIQFTCTQHTETSTSGTRVWPWSDEQFVWQSSDPSALPSGLQKRWICWICLQKGHFAQSCPNHELNDATRRRSVRAVRALARRASLDNA